MMTKREFLPNLIDTEAPLAIRLDAARALLFLHDCITKEENTQIKLKIAMGDERYHVHMADPREILNQCRCGALLDPPVLSPFKGRTFHDAGKERHPCR